MPRRSNLLMPDLILQVHYTSDSALQFGIFSFSFYVLLFFITVSLCKLTWLWVLQGALRCTLKAAEAAPSDFGSKDGDVVFVAGSTGRVGSRTVRLDFICEINQRRANLSEFCFWNWKWKTLISCRELLKLGSRVRAGVRSAQSAESLVQVWVLIITKQIVHRQSFASR